MVGSSWKAADGSRFVEEARYFAHVERRFVDLGWRRAARAARWHLSSRINALTRFAASVRYGDRDGMRTLLRHALGLTGR